MKGRDRGALSWLSPLSRWGGVSERRWPAARTATMVMEPLHSVRRKGDGTMPRGVPDREIVHVVPMADIRDHDTHTRGACWCKPDICGGDHGYVITHHSADGREMYDEGP